MGKKSTRMKPANHRGRGGGLLRGSGERKWQLGRDGGRVTLSGSRDNPQDLVIGGRGRAVSSLTPGFLVNTIGWLKGSLPT